MTKRLRPATNGQLATAITELRLIQQAAVSTAGVPEEWYESINQACRFLTAQIDKRNRRANRSRKVTERMSKRLEAMRKKAFDTRQLTLAWEEEKKRGRLN